MSQTKIEISNLSDSVVAALAVPKILSIVYPGNDTAAAPTGGQQITINGSGFAAGALVYVDNTVVGVSSIISGNQIVFTSPAKVAGSYEVKVVNLDGGVAMSNMFMQYSGTPAWSTPSGSLGNVYETSTISNTFSATSDSAVTYTVTSGSLPAGGTLNSSTGALTGTASSVGSATTYSFTVDAVDAELQETPRNFSYTINPDVVTWSSPADGSTLSGNVGDVYTQALSASSAAGKSITYTANALPTGLSISSSNITGTPSAASTITSLITATAETTNKTATRTFNWNIVSSAMVEYLVVAGGGGASGAGKGRGESSGAGAGGFLTGSMSKGTSITVTVGAGGGGGFSFPLAGPPPEYPGSAGSDSVIVSQGPSVTVTSLGGGRGGGPGGYLSTVGGSGGGGSFGTAGQGNSGYNPQAGGGTFGGGGGAGAAATWAGGSSGSNGGNGLQSSITGTATYYAGGGGQGGSSSSTFVQGSGGLGGGGAGGAFGSAGSNGENGGVNTGGGGGGMNGSSGSNTNRSAGGGGSGIVILRYLDTFPAAASTTGSPTITTAGGYRVYKFTSSGSITF